ncbi:hypothetical protein HRbin40_00134 [bacterium HR40]|nr:hypothetical protein HRbin40_00134 [bacterium HR40]
MYTDVDICAKALVKLGARPIASLDEPTVEAQVARELYPTVRDALLASYPWSFTVAQARLVRDTAAEPGDFACAFFLPPDMLRSISAGAGNRGRGLVFRIRGNRLLTDAPEVTLTYQRRVPENQFSAPFVAALVAKLAAEFALPLTENTARAESLQRLAVEEIRLARLLDSQQATPMRVEDFTLIEVRGR